MSLDVALEFRRNYDCRPCAPRFHPVAHFISGERCTDNFEILCLLHHRDQTSALLASRFVQYNRGEVSNLGANCVTEQNELNDWDSNHQCERQSVATHLDEFLAKHRDEQAFSFSRLGHTVTPSSRCCSSMKTSSIVGFPNCRVTSSLVP